MNADILTRFLITLGLIAFGWAGYRILGRLILRRASRKRLGFEGFTPGLPAVLYFTTPYCMPCKTVQRPALAELQSRLGEQIQVIQVDALERPHLADYWGVLSVPTTFIIDSHGEPRQVNHGVASAQKLLEQLQKVEGRKFVGVGKSKKGTEAHPASIATD
jgi:thiol-disulfide isomerase/thioredoxin